MMGLIRGICATFVLLAATLPALAGNITSARLADPAAEPQNWLMSGGDLAQARYSALDLIDHDSVGRLKLLQTIPYGEISAGEAFERMRFSAPLVEDGAVYFLDGLGRVLKHQLGTDGTSRPLWISEPAIHQMDKWLIGQWSLLRYRGWVVLATGDGEIFWLDADTGDVLATARVGNPREGYTLVAPPVIVDGRLIIGGAGGDRGARPRIDAIDASTGQKLWELVPSLSEQAEPGPFVAGGSFLRSGTYDATTGLMLWSSSAALPGHDARSGEGFDGTNTLFAVDVASGALQWAVQYSGQPGFSEEGTPLLHQLRDAGDETLALHLGDDGRFYRLRAASGELLSSDAVVSGASPDGGGFPAGCPNIRAERQMPGSLSPRTGLYYAAANNGCRDDLSFLHGLGGDDIGGAYVAKTTTTGALLALDPVDGSVRATHDFAAPLQSGLLSTAGGLVFAVTADGLFSALDDETLVPLWSHKLSSVLASPPITYAVEGQQYVMLILGGNPLYSQLPYVPGDMRGVRHLTVLAIYGLAP